ncbi:MAG: hypothetical protein H7A51_00055 [Akkermansiaceae bacterium]|nr:hypothetical protein [Akkermansiaceae bacterium]
MAHQIILKNSVDLSKYRDVWNDLYTSVAQKVTIFQSYEFICSAVDGTSELFVIVGVERNAIEYIFPFELNKGTLRFIGDNHSDYCMPLISNCIANKYALFKRIFKIILAEGHIRRLALYNLPHDADILNYSKTILGNKAYVYSYTEVSHLLLEGKDALSAIRHLNSSSKSELKRVIKYHQKTEHRVVTNSAAFPRTEIISLKEAMIKNGLRDKRFFDGSLEKTCKTMFDGGHLVVSLLEKDCEVQSASLVLKYGNTRLMWVDLYNDIKMINLYNYVKYIDYELALNQGVNIDFGRGGYDYKVKNFQPNMLNLYNLEFSKRFMDSPRNYYMTTRRFIKSIIKK